jgi:hypothetical protein
MCSRAARHPAHYWPVEALGSTSRTSALAHGPVRRNIRPVAQPLRTLARMLRTLRVVVACIALGMVTAPARASAEHDDERQLKACSVKAARVESYHALKSTLKEQGFRTGVGDEGEVSAKRGTQGADRLARP